MLLMQMTCNREVKYILMFFTQFEKVLSGALFKGQETANVQPQDAFKDGDVTTTNTCECYNTFDLYPCWKSGPWWSTGLLNNAIDFKKFNGNR